MHVESSGTYLIAAVADGAGGIGGGTPAAETAIAMASRRPRAEFEANSAAYWFARLQEIDAHLAKAAHGGQTTLVVASISHDTVVGAAVGDSIAWLIDGLHLSNLTAGVPRKPLLGDGGASPRAFGPVRLGVSTLLLTTDGLWKYAQRSRIAAEASGPFQGVCDRLASLVRLPSGALQDDVGVVIVREAASG